MFTGIVEETGEIIKIKKEQDGQRLFIKAKKMLKDIKEGESIAVDGVCLTVEKWGNDYFVVYVMPETMKKTTLSGMNAGSHVNLEKALSLNSRLGGHFVLGHIDTVGTISQITNESKAKIVKISIPEEYTIYLVRKGSICVNGISLTIVDFGKDYFTVSIIPHTQMVTNLTEKSVQEKVNIEVDILAKHVVRLISPQTSSKSGLTLEKLEKFGINM